VLVVQWRRTDGEGAELAMNMDRVTHNVSVDAVTGDPQSQRHHHHHHQQQQQQQPSRRESRYYFTSTLTLRSAVKQDAGVYICSATSSHGFVESRAFLHVTQSGELTPEILHQGRVSRY